MQSFFRIILLLITVSLSACSIYRLDIQQGNIVEQKNIDRLRPGLTKEQVAFVMGQPVVEDAFKNDRWWYIYEYSNGKTGDLNRKKFRFDFEDSRLVSVWTDSDLLIPEALQK